MALISCEINLYFMNASIRQCLYQTLFCEDCLCMQAVTSVVSGSVTPWTVAARLLCPWDSSGKNTGVCFHAILQGIFLTQVLNLCLLHLLHWQEGFFFTTRATWEAPAHATIRLQNIEILLLSQDGEIFQWLLKLFTITVIILWRNKITHNV